MIEIQTLSELDADGFRQIVTGYVTTAKYAVDRSESDECITFVLKLKDLEQPYEQAHDYLDEGTLDGHAQIVKHGYSLGAYDGERLVGITLAKPHTWNNSLWVWELHVAAAHRRKGVGRRLMESLAEKGKAAGLRVIVCETQTTNVPAIQFYRSAGFTMEGVDLSYYTNEDYPDGEIAVFMKRRLT